MELKIISDSAADLPREIIDEYDIEVLPLLVTLDDRVYHDGVTIKPKQLFDGMRNGKVYKTSQASMMDFVNLFTKYMEKGVNLIYIGFSSGLSGTVQAAQMAKNQVLEGNHAITIDVLDTKCASLGFGLVVYQAAKMAREGKSRKEILEAVHFYSEHMEHIFTVDDLEYLYRGGRVSRTTAFVGSLLNIKPILNVEDGKLVPIEKMRGRRKVLQRMVEIMEERGVALNKQIIAISHGDDLETALELKEIIMEEFGTKEFLINTIGGAIGAHAGPGTIALFFLNELMDK